MCKKYTKESFIEKSIEIHGNSYNYSKTEYGKNNKEKIIITCKIHGDFEQTPQSHLRGAKCYKCSLKKERTKRENL